MARVRSGLFASAVLALALVLSAVSLAAPATSAPPAKPIGCGSVITQNTTLTASIGPCGKNGLIIGADNITLDLGGFTVSGKAGRAGEGAGVLIQGRTGVTVRSGRVTDFDAGVAVVGGSGNTVAFLLVKDNIGGLRGSRYGDGIVLIDSSNNTIDANNVVHNGPLSGISMVGASSQNIVRSNLVSGNDVGAHADDGIRIEGPGASGNRVVSNTVTASGLDGIAVFSDRNTGLLNSGNVIESNVVTANGFALPQARPGDGIRLFLRANDTVIHNNTISDNAGSGIRVDSGSLNNTITSNNSSGNARLGSASILRFDLEDLNSGCDNNAWLSNTFATASQACIG